MGLFSRINSKSDAALFARKITIINRLVMQFNLKYPKSNIIDHIIIGDIHNTYAEIGRFIIKSIAKNGESYVEKVMNTPCTQHVDGEVLVAYFGKASSTLEQSWMNTRWDLEGINDLTGQTLIIEPDLSST